MASKNDLVAGFDPGGKNSFGWCVATIDPWRVVGRGVVSYAKEACDEASKVIKDKNGNLVAAGIDAPLTWARNGRQRKADKRITEWLKNSAQRRKGSAQAINSLRGACVVQGFLLAEALNHKYSGILITETNPKPLQDNPDAIKSYKGVWKNGQPDHIHDAILSAWAASQARKAYDKGWKGQVGLNLYNDEDEDQIYCLPFLEKDKTVYWWPS